MDSGVYQELSNKDYHGSEGLSSTGLKLLLKSAKAFNSPRKRKQTREQTLGILIHEAVLENKKNYVVGPDCRRGTKQWNSFVEENEGKVILKPDEADLVVGVTEAILSHHIAGKMFTNGVPEWSFLSSLGGVDVKARPDFLRHDGVIVDLKTTKSAHPDSFNRDSAKYGYHISAAFYMDIVNSLIVEQEGFEQVKQFFIVAVEKEAPYDVVVYQMTDDLLDAGKNEYQKALIKYKKCTTENKWPGISEDILPLKLPYFYEYSK